MVLILCGFMIITTDYHVDSYLTPFSNGFTVQFSIVITSLGIDRAGLYASRTFVCLSCIRFIFLFLRV